MDRPPPPDIPLAGDEETLLVAFLEFYRAEFLNRAFGLSQQQMQISLAPSTLTMSRLIGHMAMVEEIWFRRRFAGLEFIGPWDSLDWDADQDAEMTLAQTWSVEELTARFQESVADARSQVAAAASFDQRSVGTDQDGQQWDLRWIIIHMIEEYARHCGHADFIRESIDGDSASHS